MVSESKLNKIKRKMVNQKAYQQMKENCEKVHVPRIEARFAGSS